MSMSISNKHAVINDCIGILFRQSYIYVYIYTFISEVQFMTAGDVPIVSQ